MATGDPRHVGDGEIFDAYEYVGHDRAKHSWRACRTGA